MTDEKITEYKPLGLIEAGVTPEVARQAVWDLLQKIAKKREENK